MVLIVSQHIIRRSHVSLSVGLPSRPLEVFGRWLSLGFIMRLRVVVENLSRSVLLKLIEGGRNLSVWGSWLLTLIWLLWHAGVFGFVLVNSLIQVQAILGGLLLDAEGALHSSRNLVELVYVHDFDVVQLLRQCLVDIRRPSSLVHHDTGGAWIVRRIGLEAPRDRIRF